MQVKTFATGAWAVYLMLAMLLCSWLIVAQYLIVINFTVTLVVVVVIVLVAAVLNQLRVNDLKQQLQNAATEQYTLARRTQARSLQLIDMLSTLRYIFAQIHPAKNRSKVADRLFAEWLHDATVNGNILTWLNAYMDHSGTRLLELPVLTRVLDHIKDVQERHHAQVILARNLRAYRGRVSFAWADYQAEQTQPEPPHRIQPEVPPQRHARTTRPTNGRKVLITH